MGTVVTDGPAESSGLQEGPDADSALPIREQIRKFNPAFAARLDSYDRTMRLAVLGIVVGSIGAGCGIASLVAFWIHGIR